MQRPREHFSGRWVSRPSVDFHIKRLADFHRELSESRHRGGSASPRRTGDLEHMAGVPFGDDQVAVRNGDAERVDVEHVIAGPLGLRVSVRGYRQRHAHIAARSSPAQTVRRRFTMTVQHCDELSDGHA